MQDSDTLGCSIHTPEQQAARHSPCHHMSTSIRRAMHAHLHASTARTQCRQSRRIHARMHLHHAQRHGAHTFARHCDTKRGYHRMCAIASWTFHVLKIVSRVLWWLMRMQHVQHPLCRRWAFQRRWQPAENLAWHCDGLVSSATEFVLVMMKIRRRHPRRAEYPRSPPLAQPEQAA